MVPSPPLPSSDASPPSIAKCRGTAWTTCSLTPPFANIPSTLSTVLQAPPSKIQTRLPSFPHLFDQPFVALALSDPRVAEMHHKLKIGVVLSGGQAPRGHNVISGIFEMVGGNISTAQSTTSRILYDHRPLQLNNDDYDRVCRISRKKGANFRDLPEVLVKDNKVERDPSVQIVKLDSGKPLVPDYAMTFVRGTSSKPFGRLWWDEIVSTLVTRAEPHNQVSNSKDATETIYGSTVRYFRKQKML